MAASSESTEDTADKVVLEQTLLRVEETFVYKIPPMATSGGHHADDWDLGNPIATCSLHVKRVNSTLCIQLLKDRPKPNAPPGATEKHLFAQCKVCLNLSSTTEPTFKMHYYVEAVTDSSRYFVLRISNDQGREAHVGMGFRERNDALNFKMSLQDYDNAMRKEALSLEMLLENSNSSKDAAEVAHAHDIDSSVSDDDAADKLPVSKLTLKEGEKIHIKLKGVEGKRRRKSSGGGGAAVSPGGLNSMLLKKPPPPASKVGSVIVPQENKKEGDDPSKVEEEAVNSSDVEDSDDEDDWGDFEGV